MARKSIHGASWEETFQWKRPPRPDEPELKDVAVDPFLLRQFSRLDIDRPLPIPSVSVHDRRGPVSPPPARFHDSESMPGTAASSSPLPSAAVGLKSPTALTGLDVGDVPRGKVSAGWEAELAAASSPERKASEPQRWAATCR
ncbi:unnamed protein product [Urochloa humidicola]